ncbi:MAG: hypothetical protein RI947_1215 [Candidatus Parcubacteria bacterium]|jgi:hypothetical protein
MTAEDAAYNLLPTNIEKQVKEDDRGNCHEGEKKQYAALSSLHDSLFSRFMNVLSA